MRYGKARWGGRIVVGIFIAVGFWLFTGAFRCRGANKFYMCYAMTVSMCVCTNDGLLIVSVLWLSLCDVMFVFILVTSST